MDKKFNYLSESLLLQEDVNTLNKLLPAITKIENSFVSTFSKMKDAEGNPLGEELIRPLTSSGLNVVFAGIVLLGDKEALTNFQNLLTNFINTKIVPLVNSAKLENDFQPIAGKLKTRLKNSDASLKKADVQGETPESPETPATNAPGTPTATPPGGEAIGGTTFNASPAQQ